ncbi:NAD(P)-binding protein [Mollisia scopiformis]|uniref:NAD(P)-binding protein n=1 Tax=Mollisia scopiformis TaxID=149040 RepID=A0A194WZW5_MOLSC|nr:NAD(P)-binding protein [Mollisia scopiformis]KUJ13488.1 NAD(P)-binding protein [Mollisia scopiformis]
MTRSLVISGARGIGRGLARLLASKGHTIYLLDNNKEELSHTTSSLLSSFPGKILSSNCDLRNPAEITAAIENMKKHFHGQLDVLINNAAYTGSVGTTKLADLTLEEWNKSLETNLTAPMLLSQACVPLLRKGGARKEGGTIINVSSTRAYQSEPNSESYAATKAGLLGLSQALAVSLAKEGITVNALVLGWIHVGNECKKGDELSVKWEDGLEEREHEWQLTGRVGNVEDVGRAVEYLVGARGVTGTEMVVDGGVTRKMIYPE